MFVGLFVALVVLLLDQLTKYYMLHEVLGEQLVIEITSFFNLVRAWNTGVSFSMFNDYGNLGTIILSVVAGIIIIALLVWLKGEKDKLAQIALGMIIGGAVGNVIDRFHIMEKHWPAFNMADSFICVGAIILIVQSILVEKEEEKK